MLSDFGIQTEHPIHIRIHHCLFTRTNSRSWIFAVSADNREKLKENEKLEKHRKLARETKKNHGI